MTTKRSPHRSGFTLVEMLIVIVIIGMLIALIVPAVYGTILKARNARIKIEIDQIQAAIDGNLDKLGGAYPPSMANAVAVARGDRFASYVRRMFPRSTPTIYSNVAPFPVVPNDGIKELVEAEYDNYSMNVDFMPDAWGDLDRLDQAEALVFWLAGLPVSPAGTTNTSPLPIKPILRGFSANPASPWDLNGDARLSALYEFDETRLTDVDEDGWLEYVPDTGDSVDEIPPYVYFDSATYNTAGPTAPGNAVLLSYPSTSTAISTFGVGPSGVGGAPDKFSLWGAAVPYVNTTGSTATQFVFMEPKKAQIVAAGLDNQYGLPDDERGGTGALVMPYLPSGKGFQAGDQDNLTSFSPEALKESLDTL